MKPDSLTQSQIRRYLLGQCDEAELQAIEAAILTDDGAFEELLAAEDEVIDEYINKNLSPEERAGFENRFLAGPERHEQLRFARVFDRYLTSKRDAATPQPTPSRSSWAWMHSLYSSPLRVAFSAIFLVVIALGLWQVFRQSEVEKGLLALNAAYREQRPLEARISNLDYAPFVVTRGDATQNVDQNELTRAELTLQEELKENPSAAVHHALGKVYLAKKEFDRAIEQFDAGIKGDSNDASLYADLGAAWLEKGRLDLEAGASGKGTEQLGRGLENLNKALGLNPNLLEALFNRALCEEQLTLYSEAEKDWREYLTRDANSQWAQEARRRLQLLEEKKKKQAQKKDDLFKVFVGAYEAENSDKAWSALSLSRSRTGNSIVQSLLDEYLRLSAEGKNEAAVAALRKLEYAGQIESTNIGDVFTRDLAANVKAANPVQRAQIAEGRQLLNEAISRYNKSEFKEAIEILTTADQKFVQAGDECNHLFVEAWIGYCYLRHQQPEKALEIFQRLSQVFSARNYKSMLAQVLLVQAEAPTTTNEFSKALERSQESLALSRQIDDKANSVRCLQAGTSTHLMMGNYVESLQSAFSALELAEELPSDPKITWPFYHEAALDFYFLGLPSTALLFENEALRLAAELPLQKSRSYDRLALLHEGLGNLSEAMRYSELARAEGKNIKDYRSRTNILAHAEMILGRLYRATGDAKRSLDSYQASLLLYEQLGMDTYRYQAHKGKFLALTQLNDNDAAQAELDSTLYWFEEIREKIAEERLRNKFFDTEYDTYDLAVDFAYSRKNDEIKALEFAEASQARSLHDLMTRGAKFGANSNDAELKLDSVTPTLKVTDIQQKLPANVQLLEYSVLPDKTIIWVITRNSIKSTATTIARDVLHQKTQQYLNLLSRASPSSADVKVQAEDLYTTLIQPARDFLDKNLQLCIIPDDKLNFVPFASLVSPATGKYLFEDYALQIAPSATVFITSTENAKLRHARGPERLLVVGNPRFDRERFGYLPDLPAAKREAEEIAHLYGSTPLTGAEALVSRVKSALGESDVVHLATHALADDESPLLSKLLLATQRDETHHASSSYITAADIYRMKLDRPRLVVLSACRTGIEKAYRGEGAVGLARPFVVAGVPLVVASLWPVESEVTASLMISFHKHRRHGVSTVEALRRAQRDALQNSQSNSSRSYDWAAFVVIGGYADF